MSMNRYQRINPNRMALTRLDLFQSCSDEALAALLPHTDVITVEAGTVLDRSGRTARQFIGILAGYVESIDDDGRRSLLGAGEHFGATELIDAQPHRATYTAATLATVVAIFGPTFRSVASTLPLDVTAVSPAADPVVRTLSLVG